MASSATLSHWEPDSDRDSGAIIEKSLRLRVGIPLLRDAPSNPSIFHNRWAKQNLPCLCTNPLSYSP